jgi:hypothetical protein
LLRRTGIGVGLALLAVFAPCPVWTPEIFTWWQVPIVVSCLVMYIGVLLFDTLFFDRYH